MLFFYKFCIQYYIHIYTYIIRLEIREELCVSPYMPNTITSVLFCHLKLPSNFQAVR